MIRISRERRTAIAREFAVISLFVVAAVVMTWPLLPQARTHIIDVGVDDTLLYARYARCFRDWLIGREHGYLSFDMYFPSLLSGATDDAALGIAVQALPLAIFIRDYLFTINLITFASFVMCAHATYLLVRQLTATPKNEGSRGAGIVAGLAFAFCLYRMRQLEHPHVLQMQWLPYALYFMHRLADAPTRRNAIWFSLFLFFACTASFNIAIYSAFVFPPVGAWLVLTAKNRRFALIGWLLAACVLVGGSLLVIYKPFFMLRDAGAPIRSVEEVQQFSSWIESFTWAPEFSKNYGTFVRYAPDECAAFLGWVVLLLAAFGLSGEFAINASPFVAPRRAWWNFVLGAALAIGIGICLLLLAYRALVAPWARYFLAATAASVFVAQVALHKRHRASPAPIYAVVALLYAALCLGPYVVQKMHFVGPGLWQQVQRLPGFEQIRTPSRFFFVSSLCAAVLAGLGARAVADALPGTISRALFYCLAAFAALWDVRTETLPTRVMPTIATAPPVYAALARAPKAGAVVDLPVEWNQAQREFVYYANIHGRPTVNGISGWGMYYFNETMEPAWRQQPRDQRSLSRGLEAIRAEQIAGLRYAVIHRDWMSKWTASSYAIALESIGATRVGTYELDDLYELPDPPPSRPPTARDVEIHFEKIAWRDQSAGDVFVTLRFVNHTSDNLYEPTIKPFKVVATDDAGNRVGKGKGYLLPPLFTPHGDFPTNFRMQLLRGAKIGGVVNVTVLDDADNTWGAMRMKLPDDTAESGN